MTGLKCTTCNCEHNCNCHCNAGVINVDKSGVCLTKQKRKNGELEQAKVNLEASKDFDYQKSQEMLIQCECEPCVHNINCLCGSQLVNVGDGTIRTKCFTKQKEY